jgi:hypothetical protein
MQKIICSTCSRPIGYNLQGPPFLDPVSVPIHCVYCTSFILDLQEVLDPDKKAPLYNELAGPLDLAGQNDLNLLRAQLKNTYGKTK